MRFYSLKRGTDLCHSRLVFHDFLFSELTFEELLGVIKEVGFVVERLDNTLTSPYLDDAHNMLNYNYKTPLLVAVKPYPLSASSSQGDHLHDATLSSNSACDQSAAS